MEKPSILLAFEAAFRKAGKEGWSKIYVSIDIHDTIIKSNYKEDVLPKEFLPGALETLKIMSDRSDIYLILSTCSYPEEIKEYLELFKSNRIFFDAVNENPDVENTRYGYFKDKIYTNVIMDDKAGFRYTDFFYIKEFLKKQFLLDGKRF